MENGKKTSPEGLLTEGIGGAFVALFEGHSEGIGRHWRAFVVKSRQLVLMLAHDVLRTNKTETPATP